jgi:hypothetical protein
MCHRCATETVLRMTLGTPMNAGAFTDCDVLRWPFRVYTIPDLPDMAPSTFTPRRHETDTVSASGASGSDRRRQTATPMRQECPVPCRNSSGTFPGSHQAGRVPSQRSPSLFVLNAGTRLCHHTGP